MAGGLAGSLVRWLFSPSLCSILQYLPPRCVLHTHTHTHIIDPPSLITSMYIPSPLVISILFSFPNNRTVKSTLLHPNMYPANTP